MTRFSFYAAAMIGASVFVGGWALDGIEGSKHDFSNAEWSGGDKCVACHTPKRIVPPTNAPLWNLKADLSRRFGTFAAGKRAVGNGTAMCITCHDGSMAPDLATPVKQTRLSNKSNPLLFSAGHGTRNHPVGTEYPRVAKGYRPANLVTATGTVTLPDGKVECISCHDPHNLAGQKHMLVKSNARSALCLTCHKK